MNIIFYDVISDTLFEASFDLETMCIVELRTGADTTESLEIAKQTVGLVK